MQTIWAAQALTADGWRKAVAVSISADGTISHVDDRPQPAPSDIAVGILLPAPVNLHSHAFQRAMAGLTEHRGPETRDSFWTWRQLMFRFLAELTPDDIEAITALAQMEMLEAGFAAVGEFHYLHHQPDGAPYTALGELSDRIIAAAKSTGIGLTLLPVLYEHGGCDGRPLAPGQVRFGNDPDRFARLHDEAAASLRQLPSDANIGVAPHSLRAVSQEGLVAAATLGDKTPIHIHVAEQTAEVAEVEAAWGRRPVEWLLSNHAVDKNWCLIHATQTLAGEIAMMAQSGAVVGLCPITESNLGDGIFDAVSLAGEGGVFGVGSDSNVQISLPAELRTLEYSQRLHRHGRAMLATEQASTGRVLFDNAIKGGAQAVGRTSGAIAPGLLADLVALDADGIDLFDKTDDAILDSWIFATTENIVSQVWSAGRHVVVDGQHKARPHIARRYRKTLQDLKGRL